MLKAWTQVFAPALATLRQFERSLLEEGIRRRPANRNYLVCAVHATRSGDEVAYSTTVEYWELESTTVNSLLWQHGGINTVAANGFNERLVARDSAMAAAIARSAISSVNAVASCALVKPAQAKLHTSATEDKIFLNIVIAPVLMGLWVGV